MALPTFSRFFIDDLGFRNEYILLGNFPIQICRKATDLSCIVPSIYNKFKQYFHLCALLFFPVCLVARFSCQLCFNKMESRKKGSDAGAKANDYWSVKELVRWLKTNSELDEIMVIGIDFGTTYVFSS